MRGHLLTIILTIAAFLVFAVMNGIVPLPMPTGNAAHLEATR